MGYSNGIVQFRPLFVALGIFRGFASDVFELVHSTKTGNRRRPFLRESSNYMDEPITSASLAPFYRYRHSVRSARRWAGSPESQQGPRSHVPLPLLRRRTFGPGSRRWATSRSPGSLPAADSTSRQSGAWMRRSPTNKIRRRPPVSSAAAPADTPLAQELLTSFCCLAKHCHYLRSRVKYISFRDVQV